MKKLIAFLLAAIMLLSLCACGTQSNETTETSEAASSTESVGLDKNDVSNYIGTWKCTDMQFTFNKGGIGRYDLNSGFYDFKYEVENEVIVLTFSGGDMGNFVSSFELNDDGTTLTLIQNGLPGYIDGETEFAKQ